MSSSDKTRQPWPEFPDPDARGNEVSQFLRSWVAAAKGIPVEDPQIPKLSYSGTGSTLYSLTTEVDSGFFLNDMTLGRQLHHDLMYKSPYGPLKGTPSRRIPFEKCLIVVLALLGVYGSTMFPDREELVILLWVPFVTSVLLWFLVSL